MILQAIEPSTQRGYVGSSGVVALNNGGGGIRDRVFFVGVDLGQRESYTAVVVLERFDEPPPNLARVLAGDRPRRRYVVRQAERIVLDTSYTEVVSRIRGMVARIARNASSVPIIAVVDSTGVGIPVVELMRATSTGIGCRVFPIAITSGNAPTPQSVPRQVLIGKMQLMVESRDLEIAKGCRHGEALLSELAHLTLDRTSGAVPATTRPRRWGPNITTTWRWRCVWRAGGLSRNVGEVSWNRVLNGFS